MAERRLTLANMAQLCDRTERLTEELTRELEQQNGFVFNTSRRTAFYFSCEALMEFLKRNNLSHVVRAHEVQHAGFKVYMGCSDVSEFEHICGQIVTTPSCVYKMHSLHEQE